MGGDNLDDLLLGRAPGLLEVAGGGQVARLSFLPGERLVGDALEQVLQKAVLAPLGRARVGLHREHLFACEGREQRLELCLGEPAHRRQRAARERLPEHGGVLNEPPLLGAEAVQAGSDQRVQRFGDVERLDRAGRTVALAMQLQQAAVEQHAHRLDGVQRHALRPSKNLLPKHRRQAGDETVQQLLHHRRAERFEREARAPARLTEVTITLVQLGACESEHKDRVRARPLQQVLDEGEHRHVRPLHVLEHQHSRVRLRHPLEEQPPSSEEVVALMARPLLQAEQVRQPRLDPRPLLKLENMLLDRGTQLGARRVRLLALDDPGPHTHDLRQRPVGDPLPVGETATPVPENRVR